MIKSKSLDFDLKLLQSRIVMHRMVGEYMNGTVVSLWEQVVKRMIQLDIGVT